MVSCLCPQCIGGTNVQLHFLLVMSAFMAWLRGCVSDCFTAKILVLSRNLSSGSSVLSSAHCKGSAESAASCLLGAGWLGEASRYIYYSKFLCEEDLSSQLFAYSIYCSNVIDLFMLILYFEL